MAPNTALAFLIMGAGLFATVRGWRKLAGVGATIVTLVSVFRLTEFVTGASLSVDAWFFHVPAAKFGLAPVGRMAFSTAAAFLMASASLASLTTPGGWRWARNIGGFGGLMVAATGLVFSLGYMFSPDTPLLYGTESIPMALNTALAFVAIGAGLVATAGPKAFPLARLSGDSTAARLLRVFLPLVVTTVVGVAWLTYVVTVRAGASSAAITSAALATAAILVFSVICERIAGRVGERLQTAEAALRSARDELEIKVDERTRELARAFQDLKDTHESLKTAHLGLQQAQSRMLQQAMMACLGQTAAGVAHEINNPLAFVTNNLAVLKREVTGLHDILKLYKQAELTLAQYQGELHAKIRDLSEEVDLPYVLENLDGLLDRSRGGLKRIQKIVEDLRDFAHLEEAEFKEADLNSGVTATTNVMSNLAEKRQVSLEMDLSPVPRVYCFPAKLNMVIQSLISNAIDACGPGGKVVVHTRPAGDGVMIEVSDNGGGIDPAVRGRVFEPFFTTKPIGQGTGLGLSMSYGIVQDHGGMIDFESAPGHGTRFRVRIPATIPSIALPMPTVS